MGFYGKQKEVDPREFDPLYSKSGGAELRSEIFGNLPSLMASGTQAANAAADAARKGAASMRPVMQYGQNVLAGGYLNPAPALTKSLDASRAASDVRAENQQTQANNALATQQAATRSQFGRAGQTFGTTNQLAQEGSQAALQAQLAKQEQERQAQANATEAAILAENYGRERQLQQAASGVVQGAASSPLQMLQSVPGLTYAGITPAAELIRGLAGGGSVVNPNTYYKPGAGDYTLQALGTLGSVAGGGW